MKKVEVVIRSEKLDEVRKALEEVGCPGIMVTEIKGHGRQKGIELEWRAGTYRVDLLPKIKLEMVVADTEVEPVIRVLTEKASTGQVGDGKIFVFQVEEVVRIRTGERGAIAI